MNDVKEVSWFPTLPKDAGPLYLAIADAIASDIQSGALPAGVRLPPQRTLADALGIDFTTVSRAYAEARKRGLVDGRVGQGTYVRLKRPAALIAAPNSAVDMSMNLPPRLENADLRARMWKEIAELEHDAAPELLLRYQEAGGGPDDRDMGVRWLEPRLPGLSPDRVLVCPGAQGALLAVASLLAGPDRPIAAEALTYPGFRSLAAHLGIPLIPVMMDEQGIQPEAFEDLCKRTQIRTLCCTPTLHNPTTATISLDRRKAIVDIARRHDIQIIEDDAYGALASTPLPPLAALAPERVYHIAGLSKCLSPVLRLAYLVTPDCRAAIRTAGAIRATAAMASPLTAAIASRWIESGTAGEVLAAIRDETAARYCIATKILGPRGLIGDPAAFHAWLPLTGAWARGEFSAQLRAAGIGAVPSDAFALERPPEAVRLSLGAAANRDSLAGSLHTLADILDQSPAMSSIVV